ncbi:hypothetical protein SCLCIDRAFT_28090 [Scleroderma citrinum Foug A]|uniref:Uncharacterized protein n=1 Tax=Scleroderma citrinum Foug A TaxID=1036808 RepID=A0A0C3A185_9AGAM|nr:hypothetical protein SCLCIDRAFT_28090 [Scleroderma citrinum Foug A]
MDLIWTPTFILYYRPPAKKRRAPPASANDHSHHISGVLPNWECNCPSLTQPMSTPRRLEPLRECYLCLHHSTVNKEFHIWIQSPSLATNPYGGLEDDPPNVADTQAEEINSCSPSQHVPPYASPLIWITRKSSTCKSGPKSNAPTTSTTWGACNRHGTSSRRGEQIEEDDNNNDKDEDEDEDNDNGQESQLKQRTYEWHSEMAHCHYVAWAVPEPEEKLDVKSGKVFIPLSVYPYMWQDVQDSPDGPITHGLFMHDCILDTLAFFLESTQNVLMDVWSQKHPQTALALATVAVERAFKHWSTGHYALPEKKSLQKFSGSQWSYATNEV